ncbi:prepilin-type N-terminal cleavage/methylation domain-containing protein [Aromatoleum toluvorans]|uniref:Prepilin-type N-terminal cleavage/methylation domain-containing protein n=1 Tax=Aromatoleum toluvorans TaxID=92002 RepID=A0ABX1Q1D2_9RHOO|nr:type II secretion system protein [Aromatoleum toluvorans]NMG44737.1 prepilin-type N-terminal cleavage/methylation domain-containing protein [Aromatoleum toluvorans]
MDTPRKSRAGFTLIELLVVMAIIATLLAIAAPRYFGSLERSEDTALRQSLTVMRDALDHYYGDTGVYPDSLQALVDKRYLRSVPVDPITQRSDSWVLVPPQGGAGGSVGNVRSGAEGNGRDGTPYSEW